MTLTLSERWQPKITGSLDFNIIIIIKLTARGLSLVAHTESIPRQFFYHAKGHFDHHHIHIQLPVNQLTVGYERDLNFNHNCPKNSTSRFLIICKNLFNIDLFLHRFHPSTDNTLCLKACLII